MTTFVKGLVTPLVSTRRKLNPDLSGLPLPRVESQKNPCVGVK